VLRRKRKNLQPGLDYSIYKTDPAKVENFFPYSVSLFPLVSANFV